MKKYENTKQHITTFISIKLIKNKNDCVKINIRKDRPEIISPIGLERKRDLVLDGCHQIPKVTITDEDLVRNL
jgi:hypothetical protein